MNRRIPEILVAVTVVSACGAETPPGPPPIEEGVVVRFDLRSDPMPFGSIAWPDDLYLDGSGRIALSTLPGEDDAPLPSFVESLRSALAELDGFGASSPSFFFVDGPIDPESLPATPSEAVRQDASVFLLDVDPASPEGSQRVPVTVRWDEAARRIAIRPADGRPLGAGRRYAAVVTDAVADASGRALRADPRFAVVRDASTRPTDALEAEAWDHYTPVLETLARLGTDRERVVGLTLFRVQSVGDDLRRVREVLWEAEAPRIEVAAVVPRGEALDARLGLPEEELSGLDVPGGVVHGAIGFLVDGSVVSPWLLSDTAGTHGAFRVDADGRPVAGGTDAVPFTLLVPRGVIGTVPLVLFQHALGGDRSDVLAVGNALTEAGYAVLAIDAPFHGLRYPSEEADVANRFTDADGADGFGDLRGMNAMARFAGFAGEAGPLPAYHPFYLRDATRQTVIDLLAVVRALRGGALAEALSSDPDLSELRVSPEPVAFVGTSLGGSIGAMLAAVEPEIGVITLVASGGSLSRTMLDSPTFDRAYFAEVLALLGAAQDPPGTENGPPELRPEVAIWQTLVDRADPINYGSSVRGRHVDVLMLMAADDEVVGNRSTEALAKALGATLVDAEPTHVELMTSTAPLRGNAIVEGEMVTRGLFRYEPATHQLLTLRSDVTRFEHPLQRPFTEAAETAVDNPIDQALGQLVHFVESWRAGAAEIAVPVQP